MRVVYIAGPHRANSRKARDQYVRRALEAMATVWNLGGAPVCSSLHALGVGDVVAHEGQVAAGREVMSRCDCVYVAGPKSNADVRGDVACARKLEVPVFTSDSVVELRDFLAQAQG